MAKQKIVDRASYDIMLELKKSLTKIKDKDAKKAARKAIERLRLFAYRTPDDALLESKVAEVKKEIKTEAKVDELAHYKKLIFDARMKGDNAGEILMKIKDVSGKQFSKYAIHKYIKEDIEKDPKFAEYQRRYREDLEDIKIYHKKSRLDSLQQLYTQEKWKYDSAPTTSALNSLLKILEQARKEADFQANQINIFNQNNFIQNIISNEELKRALGNLPLQEVVIGRVASKSKVHPSILIDRLNTSIYSKFNGSEDTTLESMEEAPIYPAALLMDMGEIKKKNEVFVEDMKKKQEAIDNIEEAQVISFSKEDLKAKLLKKKELLKKKKKD